MKKENKTKTSWEKEFEKFTKQWEKKEYISMDELKSFIRTLLDQQRERLIRDFRAELKASLFQKEQEVKEKAKEEFEKLMKESKKEGDEK